MNKKRLSGLILSSTLVITSLTGCFQSGENNVTGVTKEELDPKKIGYYSDLKLPIDNKNTTISILCDTSVDTNNNSVIVKELRRRTGLDIQVIAVPVATINQKAKILLASKNEMPDIMRGGLNQNEINDFGLQGAFEAIEKHIDELPNFKEIFYTKAKEYKTEGTLRNYMASNGELYTFPKYHINRYVNHGMLYRKDIFDKHGIPMWNNQEEFYSALKQLKSHYPQSDPFVSKNEITIFNKLGQSWGIDFPHPYYDHETGLWKQSATDEKFKDLLNFVKKLYDEKLIDPEFITATQAAWTSKMTQANKAFVTFDWIGRLDMFREQAAPTVPEYDLRYAYPIGPTGKVVTLSQVLPGSAVKKGENSLKALKLLDYLISESGAQLITMGIEGVTYHMGEDGFAKYIGFEENAPVGINELEEKYGMFISGMYGRFDKRSTYFKYSEKEQEAQDLMLNKEGGGFLPETPILSFTDEEKESNAAISTALSKAAEEFATKYILSNETGDAAWNAWIEKANSMDANKVIENYNSAQQRYNQL